MLLDAELDNARQHQMPQLPSHVLPPLCTAPTWQAYEIITQQPVCKLLPSGVLGTRWVPRHTCTSFLVSPLPRLEHDMSCLRLMLPHTPNPLTFPRPPPPAAPATCCRTTQITTILATRVSPDTLGGLPGV